MIFLTERYNFYRLLLRVNSKALPPGGRYAVPQSRLRSPQASLSTLARSTAPDGSNSACGSAALPPIGNSGSIAYVEQVLVPTLSPGEIVMMDNLGSHKRAGIRNAIEAAGAAVSFLPAYSLAMPTGQCR